MKVVVLIVKEILLLMKIVTRAEIVPRQGNVLDYFTLCHVC